MTLTGLASPSAATPTENPVKRQHAILLGAYEKFKSTNTSHNDNFTIKSNIVEDNASGEVYGLLPYSLSTIRKLLESPAEWCKATILHINIKTCTVESDQQEHPLVTLYVADEDYKEPEFAEKIAYRYIPKSMSDQYVHLVLDSKSGPMDSGNYNIDISGIAVGPNQTFVHLNYSMQIGFFARAVLKTYLATLGRSKVGFTEVGQGVVKKGESTEPKFIGGIEGVMERNTMRYYFAFDAYLSSLNEATDSQFTSALNHWFDYTEKYRRQLYELDRNVYLQRKTRERQNQIALQAKISTVNN